MSVAPETFPKCSPDYEFIHKFQGPSLKMKIDFTVSVWNFFWVWPFLGYEPCSDPKNGKIWPFGPLLMSVAPETFPMCSPGYEFIYKFQGLSLKMKIDFTVSVWIFFWVGPFFDPRYLYRYFLCFWRCLEFCSDPCACLGVTKVVPCILSVHWNTIGAFSAFKVEIWLVTASNGRLRRFLCLI